MPEEEVGGGVPSEHKQGWGSFLKALASFSGDLSSLTAPSFILSPVSLVEFPAYWGEHPAEFAACSQGADPVERMTNVLRWFISTLKGSYTARNTSMGSEKKPLNPILGELFFGNWPGKDDRGETVLTTEQVSHHPPITAYHLENQKAGVTLEGHSGQKTTFSGRAIQVKQVGHAVLRVKPQGAQDAKEELYLITLPTLTIEGLWYGSPYVELLGTTHIASSTGFLSTINYTGRGYFSGKSHSFKATVSPIAQPTQALYTAEGDWSGVSKFKGKGPSGSEKDAIFWDAGAQREEISVKPIEEQGPMESRKVWKDTAEGIRTGNFDIASKDKSRIENDERQKRKDEAAAGTPHQLEYFVHVEDDTEYAELIGNFGGKPANEEAYRRKPRVH
ncbi:Oxysterol-binding protein [Tilletiaria anomala UBC 951]|uniref:Oxysterol-binding protein n=1 Tax=Tilletiaria anomala (strain ATCC 24038 / CBS 436.72 / UBC 951) TaxID=1037660 RepID=A0A066WAB9_TILAU|nr:Oxysterol-binding protein [Tilletiaria anomala UBC 951]KDN50872.1 Oxysterol-binding protein [Tilletiaria anomala UBC 951]